MNILKRINWLWILWGFLTILTVLNITIIIVFGYMNEDFWNTFFKLIDEIVIYIFITVVLLADEVKIKFSEFIKPKMIVRED